MLRRVLVGAAAIVFGLMAGSAQARPAPRGEAERATIGSTRDDPIPAPQALVLRGTHGWWITIDSYRATHRHPATVDIHAEGRVGAVRYTAPARTVEGGIHAELGPFGRIDLRWVPDGRVTAVHFSCHGHKPRRQIFFRSGAYVGTLRFRGGNGFTEVRRDRIKWRPSWYRGLSTCRREGGESLPGPGEILHASADRAEGNTAQGFWVYQPRPGKRVVYSAAETEVRGRIEIERSTWAFGAPPTLSFSSDFADATVEPPAPFSGTASFARTKGEHGTWLGDLRVDFPDGSNASLAGPSFESVFHSGLLEGISR